MSKADLNALAVQVIAMRFSNEKMHAPSGYDPAGDTDFALGFFLDTATDDEANKLFQWGRDEDECLVVMLTSWGRRCYGYQTDIVVPECPSLARQLTIGGILVYEWREAMKQYPKGIDPEGVDHVIKSWTQNYSEPSELLRKGLAGVIGDYLDFVDEKHNLAIGNPKKATVRKDDADASAATQRKDQGKS